VRGTALLIDKVFMINGLPPDLTITSENIDEIASILNRASPIELADFIKSKSTDDQILIFNLVTKEKEVLTFEYLPFTVQKNILLSLSSQRVADLLNSVSPDDRTALLEELPTDLVNLLLKYLSKDERAIATKLLGYPEDSVGRLMTPDYLAIKLHWTVRRAIDYIREKGKDSETINVIYAVDNSGVLLDDFRIRQLLLASLDAKLEDLADYDCVALQVEEPREQAINVFRKYDRVALPVVDAKGVLLGIVTSDDIIEAAVEEDTEDMQMIGGVEALNAPYMEIPLWSLIQKRMNWLVILFFGEMLTASAMGFFQDEISKAVILALFIPLIISSGGNAGSQASTLIIRALALDEVTLRDWWRIMRREIFSGLLLGTVLGLIGFGRVFIWTLFSSIYGEYWSLVALTIFFALIGVVLWGTLIGSMMPLILKRFGFDPAVSSTPLVATLVDVTGLIIYFTIALFVLQGTLL
jgi:magnesium transporter